MLLIVLLLQTCFYAPTITPISPTSGPTAVISGSVLLKADAVSNCPNRTIHLKAGIDLSNTFPPCATIPDNCIGEDLTAPGPYAVLMDTTRWSNGLHSVWIEAYDQYDASASYSFFIDIENPLTGSDAQPPEAFIQLPRDGDVLTSRYPSVTVEGNYADNFAVVQVDLLVNDQLYGSSYTAPFDIAFTAKKRGVYRLQTRAWDAAGNSALSQMVTVTR